MKLFLNLSLNVLVNLRLCRAWAEGLEKFQRDASALRGRLVSWHLLAVLISVPLAFTGCASFNQLSSEVSTYGTWPAEKSVGRFVFERLPSQLANLERQQMLEQSAEPVLTAIGFVHVDDASSAEFSVQLDSKVSRNDVFIYDNPLWWPGPMHGPRYDSFTYWSAGPAFQYRTASYEHEVSVLIRDQKTGVLLFESRSQHDDLSPTLVRGLLPSMFESAMKDFPFVRPGTRRVRVQIRDN